jgi:hypothetical protein
MVRRWRRGGGGVVDLGFQPRNPKRGIGGGEKEGRMRKLHPGEIIGRGEISGGDTWGRHLRGW